MKNQALAHCSFKQVQEKTLAVPRRDPANIHHELKSAGKFAGGQVGARP